jgi:DNA-binding transcriptional regulator YiaG
MNSSNNNPEPRGRPLACPDCGERTVREFQAEQLFPYGAGDDRVMLRAVVPVMTCESCGEQFTDWRAEEIRHEARCNHLGRMAPNELRALRESYELSQEQWAEVTGLGLASIKRWETGNKIQNDAYDRYLWLLLDPTILALLQQRGANAKRGNAEPEFRTPVENQARYQAKAFELCPRLRSPDRRVA